MVGELSFWVLGVWDDGCMDTLFLSILNILLTFEFRGKLLQAAPLIYTKKFLSLVMSIVIKFTPRHKECSKCFVVMEKKNVMETPKNQ